jgi:hypothetical protein
MKATALSALALLLLAGAANAADPSPPDSDTHIADRLSRRGAAVARESSLPGRPVRLVVLPASAGDPDLAELCELRGLEILDLSWTRVTDEGLRCVGDLRQLRRLPLFNTSVTDAGLRHLEGLGRLEHLDLRGCPNVTAEGVRRLREALPGCEVVR